MYYLGPPYSGSEWLRTDVECGRGASNGDVHKEYMFMSTLKCKLTKSAKGKKT